MAGRFRSGRAIESAVLAAAMLVPLASPRADSITTTANKLLFYDTGSARLRDLIEDQAANLYAGADWLNTVAAANAKVYCPPNDLAVDGKLVIAMVRKEVARFPRTASAPFGLAVVDAAIHEFPCPRDSN